MWCFFYQIELVGKQLEESIKPLAFGSWFYAFLSLFANSFNLVRYSSRGGHENQLGWRLVGFRVHHSLNILKSNTRSNEESPRGILKYTRLWHTMILHYFSCYFSEKPPPRDFRSSISDSITLYLFFSCPYPSILFFGCPYTIYAMFQSSANPNADCLHETLI